MKTLIQHGRVIDPASGFDAVADVAMADGRILAIGQAPSGFVPDALFEARDHVVIPGLVDLCARLGEPGHEHERMLDSELAAAVAGGVTTCAGGAVARLGQPWQLVVEDLVRPVI